MTEIELKFLLDAPAERRLRRLGTLRSMTSGRATTRQLRSVYYDSEDGRLRKAGIALRVRFDGRDWLQTVKAGREMRAGLARVDEVESERDGPEVDLTAIPDAALRDRIVGLLAGQSLGPVIETAFSRTIRMIDHGGSWIEFALDRGEIIAGDRRAPFCECELELIEGEPQHLFDGAAAIFSKGLIRPAGRSKVERGWLLAETGRIDLPAAVRKARKVPLDRSLTTEEALRTIVAETFDQIIANAHVVMSDEDAAGPYQMRVGLRRLRTALRLLPKRHHPPRFGFLLDEARHLAGIAGRLRDIDVLREHLRGTESDPALDQLDAALAERAGMARADLRVALEKGRTQRFLLEVGAAAALGPRRPRAGELGSDHLDQPVEVSMTEALERGWRRVARRARSIASLDHEARHELRKALKALRYTVEFASPLHDKNRLKPFLREMKALQDVFGSLNDLAMFEPMLLGASAPCRDDPDVQRAVGLIIGAERARAEHDWQGAKEAWKALRKRGPFWD